MQLRLDVRAAGTHTVVTAHGEIDVATSGHLRQTLTDLIVGGDANLVLVLENVTFLDSTGLGALIGARRRAHALKGSLSLVCPPGHLTKLFQITSLDKVFALHDSVEAALPVGAAVATCAD